MSLSYFWGFELTLVVLTALVLASWIIARQRRADLACTNLQRLVALEHQAFQDELNFIGDDFARIANTADSASKSVTSIGNAVVEAIRKIETRLDRLKEQTDELSNRYDEQSQNFEASEIRQLRATIERISKSQTLIEDRLSDDIRFNLERAKITDASLKGFASRVEAFSERLNALGREYKELSASVEMLKQPGLSPLAAAPQSEQVSVGPETGVAPIESGSQPRVPLGNLFSQSNIAGCAEEADVGVANPNDEAA